MLPPLATSSGFRPIPSRTQRVFEFLLWAGLVLAATTVWAGVPQAKLGLSYPVGGPGMPQPTCLYVDAHRGEIYVADATSSRVVIFDRHGRYDFEFKTAGRLNGLRQVVADSLGRILVLGDPREHTLAQYDYNGDFLRYLDLYYPGTDSLLDVASMALDGRDQLYLLCARPAHIYVYTACGAYTGDFPIFEEMDSETQESPVPGTLAVIDQMLVIPLPMDAQVARYTMDGKLDDIIGMMGGGPGELSFPVAVIGNGRGGMYVLDKHRHTVLEYDRAGNYLREFGGLGQSVGWFYHPTTLAVSADGLCLVGQTFQNRVQAMLIQEPAGTTGLSTTNP